MRIPFLLYFDQVKCNLKPKSMYFSLSCSSTFYCGSYTLQKILFFSCFTNENMKKLPLKVGYFSRIAEIFITTLSAQTAQKAVFLTSRSLLMQDWVIRLGTSHYFGQKEFIELFLPVPTIFAKTDNSDFFGLDMTKRDASNNSFAYDRPLN